MPTEQTKIPTRYLAPSSSTAWHDASAETEHYAQSAPICPASIVSLPRSADSPPAATFSDQPASRRSEEEVLQAEIGGLVVSIQSRKKSPSSINWSRPSRLVGGPGQELGGRGSAYLGPLS